MLSVAPITLPTRVRADIDASSTALVFGDVVQDAISVATEEDLYTFAANAGDLVLVRMSRTGGTFSPSIQIEDAGGATLCAHYATTLSSSAQIASCALPDTATYTLRAADYSGTTTGPTPSTSSGSTRRVRLCLPRSAAPTRALSPQARCTTLTPSPRKRAIAW